MGMMSEISSSVPLHFYHPTSLQKLSVKIIKVAFDDGLTDGWQLL